MKFKKIIKNINLLNTLLFLVIFTFALYSLYPLINIKVKYSLPDAKKKVEEVEEATVQNQIPSIAEYMNIPEENLFHPERKIPDLKKEEQPLPKPEFVLYGTLITNDLSMAYLEDLKAPYTTPGRGKRQRPLKKGDTISGFTLKEIEADKVVMLRGEERLVISLNDLKARVSTAITEPSRPASQSAQTVTQAPLTTEAAKAPATTSTPPKWPPPSARRTPATVPAQQGTTGQTDFLKQGGPSNIKNVPYNPKSSQPKGLLGIQ
ncbi:MAG: hypothetical protein HXY53_02710 [Nitrospirae bacterium]|nr:hypothetical protein [Nitrospirota bacterium]